MYPVEHLSVSSPRNAAPCGISESLKNTKIDVCSNCTLVKP